MTDRRRKNPKIGTKEVEGVICGRNGAVIPPEEVAKLASYHCSNDEMAEFFGVSRTTLESNFKDIIDMNKAMTKHKLRKKQLEVAFKGDKTMLIWLGKVILGQSEDAHTQKEDQILPWVSDDNNEDDNT